MEPDLNKYRSHEHKNLTDHINGVVSGTKKRTTLQIAEIAAIFHDVGKLNPHFQAKLPNSTFPKGTYSNHSCLSAYAFLCFSVHNSIKQTLGLTITNYYSVIALVARHHGNLPNFEEGIIGLDEQKRMFEFLNSEPELPAYALLKQYLAHTKFNLLEHSNLKILGDCNCFKPEEDWLNFFMETQFGFAALIELDKRDAGDNDEERRERDIARLSDQLTAGLAKPFVTQDAITEKTKQLNEIRSRIRVEALQSVMDALNNSKERIFCLTAPTGSGKTLTLLALANAILRHRSALQSEAPPLRGIIYALPFLSITEQVEGECQKLLEDETLILRADSAAHHPHFEALLAQADDDPEAAVKLLREDFAEQVFDCPLVITTFVQFFETLMSNRNATLLKLPNFARSVIIIDEVQALPPRLYIFFAAYLDAFCRKFDAYVIFSTATMPALAFPKEDSANKAKSLFPCYKAPRQLIAETHFKRDSFQRYRIEPRWDISSLESLASEVQEETKKGRSIMVVLNTIDDTRQLYRLLNPDDAPHIHLLNTLFTPEDRRAKINHFRDLEKKPPLILITTQLIEAGVDIDFPIVYRDLCPFPNLVQTAGRCNRHNALAELGRTILIDIKRNGKPRAETIYLSDMQDWYLKFTRKHILKEISENELFDLQTVFFEAVRNNLIIGNHPGLGKDRNPSNLIDCIRDAAFEDAGKFSLIQEEGEQYAFYIPDGNGDDAFDKLQRLADALAQTKKSRDFKLIGPKKIEIEGHLRKMRNRVVQARIKDQNKANKLGVVEIMGIRKINDTRSYTDKFGLEIAEDDNFC